MAWNDDSWKDSYDTWKLASPDDYYDDDPDEELCDHEDFDADPITGRAYCYRCGYGWTLTSEEIQRHAEHEREYAKAMRRQERRDAVARFLAPFAFWRPWRKPSPIDDEIPF